MIKPTPNPPEHEATSPYESFDSKKLHEAAERALDHHLGTPPDTNSKHRNGCLFSVCPNINTETLLVHASESLASASVMASDLAGFLDGPHRNTLLGIQQVIMLGELAVNRALDNIDPQD